MTNELESLAASFHRALAFGHVIAAWFNWRRKNWRWVAFHAVVAWFDFHAAQAHERDSNA
jgi:hypothetical protein